MQSQGHVPVVCALTQLPHSYGELWWAMCFEQLLQAYQSLIILIYDGKGTPVPCAHKVNICLQHKVKSWLENKAVAAHLQKAKPHYTTYSTKLLSWLVRPVCASTDLGSSLSSACSPTLSLCEGSPWLLTLDSVVGWGYRFTRQLSLLSL